MDSNNPKNLHIHTLRYNYCVTTSWLCDLSCTIVLDVTHPLTLHYYVTMSCCVSGNLTAS